MSTSFADTFGRLAAPFEADEVKQLNKGGRRLSYVTARSVMNRLDSVLGPENWWDEYTPMPDSIMCRLTIRLEDGRTITKADVGGYAGMETKGRNGQMVRDEENDPKTAFSDALKRAAAKFGIARYLYGDGVPEFGGDGASTPVSPDWQQSQGGSHGNGHQDHRPASNGHSAGPPGNGPQRQGGDAPRSGKGLFAWTKDQEQRYEVGLLKYLQSWGKLREFPNRMVDWDDAQVAEAHAEALRKLASVNGGGSQEPQRHGRDEYQSQEYPTGGSNGHHPDAPGAREGAELARVATLRKEVAGKIQALAVMRSGTDDPNYQPSPADLKATKDGIDLVMDGGQVAESIAACKDVALLEAYSRIASEQMEIVHL